MSEVDVEHFAESRSVPANHCQTAELAIPYKIIVKGHLEEHGAFVSSKAGKKGRMEKKRK